MERVRSLCATPRLGVSYVTFSSPRGSFPCYLFPAWGEGGVGGYRAFPVRLPSGVRYWTVLDAGWRVAEPADGFLLHTRLGRDLAESSTKAYAISLALFLDWCEGAGLAWPQAPRALGRFVHWLRFDDPVLDGAQDSDDLGVVAALGMPMGVGG